MTDTSSLIAILNTLEEKQIYYRLNKHSQDSVLIEVTVSGQRWEIRFLENGAIEIEKFFSDGVKYSGDEIESLWKYFSK